MRRRRLVLTLLILLTAFVLVVGGLGLLLKQVPAFYYSPETAAQADDDVVASAVITRAGDLQSGILADPEWGASFAAAELNAFFREHVDDGKQLAYKMPESLHDPRIAVEGDRIRLAFRIGEGYFSAIGSVELQAWLVDKEVNTVAVKLCSLRVGMLPGESQWVLDRITEWARNQNIDVSWYRHEGQPVGIFRFYANQQRPPTQIRTVVIGDGRLAVRGRSTLDGRLPSDLKPKQ